MSPITRRALLGSAAAATAVVAGGFGWRACPQRQELQRVTVLGADTYSHALGEIIIHGLQRWPSLVARLPGARVLLKTNLVEHHPDRPINTDPWVVVAAVEALRQLGAAEVIVGDAPGHRRDSEALLLGSGLGSLLGQLGVRFVDLNYDAFHSLPLQDDLSGLRSLPVAATLLEADMVISLAKLKTHHWAGVTLSMKNLFGALPGVELGWPKNRLHWAGIEGVTVDLWRSIAPDFAIVDGVVGMQGDGPIMGDPVHSGFIAMGDHLPAVDAHCARLMGITPERLPTMRLARAHGATIAASRIVVEGDRIAPQDFELLPRWAWLR